MAIINAPVTIANVASIIRAGGTDLADIIDNGNINKWAKYKPVRNAARDTVTGQWDAVNNRWSSSATWWKGTGGCGLSWSEFDTLTSSFISQLMAGSLQWTYQRPGGGSSQPYRLQDFARYIDDAEAPIGTLAGAGRTIYVPSSGSGMRNLTLNYESPSVGDENLSLADFETTGGRSFTDMWLGVILYKNASNYRILTSTNKIGNTGSTLIETQIGFSDVGTWQVMPFLSSIQISATSPGQSGTFLSAGYSSPDTIIIASQGTVYRIDTSATWTSTSYNRIAIDGLVVNDNSVSKTFTGGLTYYVYETEIGATTGAAGTLVGQVSYNTTFTVGANSSYQIPSTLYVNYNKNNNKEYWVTARFADGTTLDNQYEPVQDEFMHD